MEDEQPPSEEVPYQDDRHRDNLGDGRVEMDKLDEQPNASRIEDQADAGDREQPGDLLAPPKRPRVNASP